jgi:uncharacterized protein
MIIDVDAHAEPTDDWLDDVPKLKERLSGRFPESDPLLYLLPTTLEQKVEYSAVGLAGHVQQDLPPEMRIPGRQLAASFHEMSVRPDRAGEFFYEGSDQMQPVDVEKRDAWLRESGIAVQSIISNNGIFMTRFIEDYNLGQSALIHLNTFMTDRLQDHKERQRWVAWTRYEDLDAAIREITRVRGRGCRTFMIPGVPVNNVPLYDPSFDRLWDAAVDLGMVAQMHVGLGPAFFPGGWANTKNPQMVRYLATAGSPTNAMLLINALIFGGVFERHPRLTLLISEFGIEWVPYLVANMDARARGDRIHDTYPHSLLPSEFMSRNVRISSLPGQNPMAVLEQYPNVAVFSSDYPHFEGTPDPVNYYSEVVANASSEAKAAYFGGAMVESYAMTGDPIVT